jgi:hypothetical protein
MLNISGTFRSTRETGFLAFSPLLSRGTEGSNPAPSSKESGANLPRCAHLHGRRVTVFCSEEFALLPSDDDFRDREPDVRIHLPPAESRVRCVATALIGHTNFADRNQEIHFLKNMAMTGGFLYVAAFGGGAWSLEHDGCAAALAAADPNFAALPPRQVRVAFQPNGHP